jgi:hypothetical protein
MVDLQKLRQSNESLGLGVGPGASSPASIFTPTDNSICQPRIRNAKRRKSPKRSLSPLKPHQTYESI